MLVPLVALFLTAAPVKLATVPFERAGIDQALAGLVQDTLANKLAESPLLQVTTPRDVTALLGLERQKQLLGCPEQSTNCMAELGGALGVDALVTGSIGRAGKSFQLNVKVIDASGAKALFVYTSDVLSSEDALLAESTKVAQLIAQRFEELHGSTASSASNWAPWILFGTGVAVAGTGAVFAILAKGQLDTLNGTANISPPSTPELVRDQGKTYQSVSIALLATGGAMMVGGLVWRFAFPKSPVTGGAWLTPGQGQVFVRLELP
jgi:TolB-like protein